MSLPSTLHHTSFTFDKLPPGQTLDQCLLKGIHNIIRQEDATDIPPLFSELLPLGVPSADHFLKEVAPAIGKAALVLALVVQSIKIKRSMTSYMISVCLHQPFHHCNFTNLSLHLERQESTYSL